MLHDEYFMNKNTGELLPSGEAIRDFYKSHGWRERWTDEWEPTGIEIEDSMLDAPDFRRAVSI